MKSKWYIYFSIHSRLYLFQHKW